MYQISFITNISNIHKNNKNCQLLYYLKISESILGNRYKKIRNHLKTSYHPMILKINA